MEKYQELIELFCKQDPEIIFKKIPNKNSYPDLDAHERMAFGIYFDKQYSLVEKIWINTYSTNRLFYSVFYNKLQNDVRIEKLAYGCFHGGENFVSIEQINQTEKEILVEIGKHQQPNFTGRLEHDLRELESELEGIRKVQALYAKLKGVSADEVVSKV